MCGVEDQEIATGGVGAEGRESFLEFFFRNEAPRIMRGTKEVEEELRGPVLWCCALQSKYKMPASSCTSSPT